MSVSSSKFLNCINSPNTPPPPPKRVGGASPSLPSGWGEGCGGAHTVKKLAARDAHVLLKYVIFENLSVRRREEDVTVCGFYSTSTGGIICYWLL